MGNQLSNIKGQVYSNSRMKKMHLFLSYGGVNMWNPFKPKFRVPVEDINIYKIIDIIVKENNGLRLVDLFEYIEQKFGITREWSWRTHKNYLVFDSKEDYLMFMLKL
jgi:hypothetical protein